MYYQNKMTQHISINVKWSNSQLHKLKSGIKNSTEITLNVSSNVIGDSNDETNLQHELLLNNRQVSRLRKAFTNNTNNSSATRKLVQSGGFLGNLLAPLINHWAKAF